MKGPQNDVQTMMTWVSTNVITIHTFKGRVRFCEHRSFDVITMMLFIKYPCNSGVLIFRRESSNLRLMGLGPLLKRLELGVESIGNSDIAIFIKVLVVRIIIMPHVCQVISARKSKSGIRVPVDGIVGKLLARDLGTDFHHFPACKNVASNVHFLSFELVASLKDTVSTFTNVLGADQSHFAFSGIGRHGAIRNHCEIV